VCRWYKYLTHDCLQATLPELFDLFAKDQHLTLAGFLALIRRVSSSVVLTEAEAAPLIDSFVELLAGAEIDNQRSAHYTESGGAPQLGPHYEKVLLLAFPFGPAFRFFAFVRRLLNDAERASLDSFGDAFKSLGLSKVLADRRMLVQASFCAFAGMTDAALRNSSKVSSSLNSSPELREMSMAEFAFFIQTLGLSGAPGLGETDVAVLFQSILMVSLEHDERPEEKVVEPKISYVQFFKALSALALVIFPNPFVLMEDKLAKLLDTIVEPKLRMRRGLKDQDLHDSLENSNNPTPSNSRQGRTYSPLDSS
jgi:hypothetical protein